VAARTYGYDRATTRRATSNWEWPWDLYSTVNDQVYHGLSKEIGEFGPAWVAAVDATSNQVLLYDGDPITAFYEEHPYPPPVADLTEYAARWSDGELRRVEHHRMWPSRALREDPTIAVAENDWDRLPTKVTRRKDGTQTTRLQKDAFVYDDQNDCYWCPAGKPLADRQCTSESRNGRRRIRYRYYSNPSDCAGCPLRDRCLSGRAKKRQVGHEQHERIRRSHRKKMQQPESKAKYGQRRHPGERPFAVIKAGFGVRQFSSRGLKRVRNEWTWLASAFNLDRLLSLVNSSGLDPPACLMPCQ
jgi:hypothetical protein